MDRLVVALDVFREIMVTLEPYSVEDESLPVQRDIGLLSDLFLEV